MVQIFFGSSPNQCYAIRLDWSKCKRISKDRFKIASKKIRKLERSNFKSHQDTIENINMGTTFPIGMKLAAVFGPLFAQWTLFAEQEWFKKNFKKDYL